MTEQEAIKKVLSIAAAEVGYKEKFSGSGLDDHTANAGGGNYTKYARDLDRIPGFYNGPKQGYAWCDVFYDWLIVAAFGPDMAKKLLCQPDNSAGAGCAFSLSYYQQAGRAVFNPQPGDQIFFTYRAGEISHTGIVEKISGGIVYTIEGNSSDGVNRRSYAVGVDAIFGYGRPRWELLADVQDQDADHPDDADPESPDTNPKKLTYRIELPVIREGDEGPIIEHVQTLLIARGYYCGGRTFGGREKADGEFGPATKVALLDFQLACGIEQHGDVDGDTMHALLTK